MNKQELNLAIAKLVEPYQEWFSDSKGRAFWKHIDGFIHEVQIVDYCNDWNDLMPLVVEHSQWFYIDSEYAEISNTTGVVRVEHNNEQQIALAECLLRVLEAKDE